MLKESRDPRLHFFFKTILDHGLHRRKEDSSTLKPTLLGHCSRHNPRYSFNQAFEKRIQ